MYLCLFEDDQVDHLQPLSATRGVYDLRLGIRTLLQASRDAFGQPAMLLHARRLVAAVTAQENDVLTNRIPEGLDVLFLNGRYLAEEGPVLDRLRQAARAGEPGLVFAQGKQVIAAWVPGASNTLVQAEAVTSDTFEGLPEEQLDGARLITHLWDLIDELPRALARDYAASVSPAYIYERPGAEVHESAILVEGERVYIAPGAVVRPGVVLNASEGPIYIGADAVIHERAVILGPAYIGPKAHVKVGADVQTSAIGTWSKVGGEVHSSIVHSFSNKAHPGYLGHSYLGRWCNLGAGTNTSNLKNDYGDITLYDAATAEFVPSGRQFLGLFMGDHAKCGIQTMFNTGTVVGVMCNVYGAGFPPRHIPSFSWGSAKDGFVPYRLDKALRVAEAVMARRDRPLTDADRAMLTALSEQAEETRT